MIHPDRNGKDTPEESSGFIWAFGVLKRFMFETSSSASNVITSPENTQDLEIFKAELGKYEKVMIGHIDAMVETIFTKARSLIYIRGNKEVFFGMLQKESHYAFQQVFIKDISRKFQDRGNPLLRQEIEASKKRVQTHMDSTIRGVDGILNEVTAHIPGENHREIELKLSDKNALLFLTNK